MRMFLPLIAGMLIGAATLTFGQPDVGPIREQSSSLNIRSATEEIQILEMQVKELRFMVQHQIQEINELRIENMQLKFKLEDRQP